MTIRDRLWFLGLYALCFIMGAVVVGIGAGVPVLVGKGLGL